MENSNYKVFELDNHTPDGSLFLGQRREMLSELNKTGFLAIKFYDTPEGWTSRVYDPPQSPKLAKLFQEVIETVQNLSKTLQTVLTFDPTGDRGFKVSGSKKNSTEKKDKKYTYHYNNCLRDKYLTSKDYPNLSQSQKEKLKVFDSKCCYASQSMHWLSKIIIMIIFPHIESSISHSYSVMRVINYLPSDNAVKAKPHLDLSFATLLRPHKGLYIQDVSTKKWIQTSKIDCEFLFILGKQGEYVTGIPAVYHKVQSGIRKAFGSVVYFIHLYPWVKLNSFTSLANGITYSFQKYDSDQIEGG